MESRIPAELLATTDGQKADEIIRKCVHCGFCLATCPTYQLLGDERDSPRGRIYLIKELLEGEVEEATVQHHLDRCLTCRACETTCPSGVEYGRLLEIGRETLRQRETPRPTRDRWQRFLLRKLLVNRNAFAWLALVGRSLRNILPRTFTAGLAKPEPAPNFPVAAPNTEQTVARVILFQGCVQPTLAPNTNLHAQQVLERLGVDVLSVSEEGCCGALPYHLSATEQTLALVKNNIDAWWPHLQDEKLETAIISTASACGLQIKDYPYLMREEPSYLEKAEVIADRCYDFAEYLVDKDLSLFNVQTNSNRQKIAFHAPCTLQHGQKITGMVEALLRSLGYEVVTPRDAHLCCGSAGTYSVLQPGLSERLQRQKLEALEATGAEVFVTANIGCQMHLQAAAAWPVKHWVELLIEA